MHYKRPTLALLCALLAAGAALAEVPRFEIRRFVFSGASLVPVHELEAATRPFTGALRSLADVQLALEAVARVYSDAGYGAVRVTLPEQRAQRGEIAFQIIEPRIAALTIEGARFFDEANIRASLPAARAGLAPNARDIARDLRLANDNPAKRASLLLRGAAEADSVEAVARVTDRDPRRLAIAADNGGKAQRPRAGFAYEHANAAGGDEVLRLAYVTTGVLGAGYRIPLYGRGVALDLAAGYSEAEVAGGFMAFGLMRQLEPVGRHEHSLALAFARRSYDQPHAVRWPVELQYAASHRRASAESQLAAGVSSDPVIWHAAARHLHRLAGDWRASLGLHGQYSRHRLVPGEQFGIGGADSVRGFDERSLAADRGHRGSLELATPDFGLRALAFLDWGAARGERIAAWGAGLRYARGGRLSARCDWAVVAEGAGVRRQGDDRLHLGLAYEF